MAPWNPAASLPRKTIDVHLDDVRRAFPVRFPQALAQHLAASHHLAGMAQCSMSNTLNSVGVKIDINAAMGNSPRAQVEVQLADGRAAGPACSPPTAATASMRASNSTIENGLTM